MSISLSAIVAVVILSLVAVGFIMIISKHKELSAKEHENLREIQAIDAQFYKYYDFLIKKHSKIVDEWDNDDFTERRGRYPIYKISLLKKFNLQDLRHDLTQCGWSIKSREEIFHRLITEYRDDLKPIFREERLKKLLDN